MSEWRETNRAWWDERVPIHVGSEPLRRRGVPGRRLEAPRLRDRGGRGRRRPHAGRTPSATSASTRSRGRAAGRASRGSTSRPRRSRRRAPWPNRAGPRRRVRPGRRLRRRRGPRRPALRRRLHRPRGAQLAAGHRALGAGHGRRSSRPAGASTSSSMHPFVHVFADDGLTVTHPYFQPEGFAGTTTAAPTPTPTRRTEHNRTIEWSHPVGEVVTALAWCAGWPDRAAARARPHASPAGRSSSATWSAASSARRRALARR